MYMRVIAFVALAALALVPACGSEQDDRPATFDYVVLTVLRPSCGRATCHSSLTKIAGYAFDTISASRESIQRGGLVVPGAPDSSELINVITGGGERMPPDGPMPDKDIDLIVNWILDGGATN